MLSQFSVSNNCFTTATSTTSTSTTDFSIVLCMLFIQVFHVFLAISSKRLVMFSLSPFFKCPLLFLYYYFAFLLFLLQNKRKNLETTLHCSQQLAKRHLGILLRIKNTHIQIRKIRGKEEYNGL